MIYILSCETIQNGGGIYDYDLTEKGKLIQLAYFPCDRPMYAVKCKKGLCVLLRQPFENSKFSGYFYIDENLKTATEIKSTQGVVACHLCVDNDDVYIVNYLSGNIVKNGAIIEQRQGKGKHPMRQAEPHTHFIDKKPDGHFAVCDLGTDALVFYDKDCVREAWINACVHNDYSTHLGPSIYLYADHLEVFSYGNALKNITKEKFLKGISSPINPELAKICMRLEYVEESGKGINTIVGKYGEEVFEFEDTYLQVNIPYNKKALPDENGTVNKTEKSVLELLSANTNITVAELMQKTGKAERTVKRALASLKEKGLIERVGSDKTGYWKVL